MTPDTSLSTQIEQAILSGDAQLAGQLIEQALNNGQTPAVVSLRRLPWRSCTANGTNLQPVQSAALASASAQGGSASANTAAQAVTVR